MVVYSHANAGYAYGVCIGYIIAVVLIRAFDINKARYCKNSKAFYLKIKMMILFCFKMFIVEIADGLCYNLCDTSVKFGKGARRAE